MKAKDQKRFYTNVGRALTTARTNRKLTIPQLVKLSGEQYNTILHAEQGKPFSLHQAQWIRNILKIDLNELISSAMEGEYEQEVKGNVVAEVRADEWI